MLKHGCGSTVTILLRFSCKIYLLSNNVSNQTGATKPILKRTTRVRLNIGWSVLAFLGLVISLICLLLGRIYRPFLINTLCNLFYDFAACLFLSCCYTICQTFILFTKVYICSGMAYGTSSMGSWDLVCRMGCAEYTYLYSDNIYICYSFIGLYAKDYIFTYAYSVNL